MKCVTSVSESFTRNSSNKTNVWQETFAPTSLAFFAKLSTKNYKNPSIFVKVTAKNSVTPFYVDTVYLWSLTVERCIFEQMIFDPIWFRRETDFFHTFDLKMY